MRRASRCGGVCNEPNSFKKNPRSTPSSPFGSDGFDRPGPADSRENSRVDANLGQSKNEVPTEASQSRSRHARSGAMEGFVQGHALPEVFEREVLTRLDTHDTAMLARVSRAARHATVRAGARAQLTVSSSCRTLRMARWGRDNGMPWDWRVCAAAAQAGNLRVLEWARAEGCGFPWDVLCAFAAGGGSVDVLRWAREKAYPRCPWDAETCAAAAEKGHLEVVQWCVRRGCPWDKRTIQLARNNGHAHVVAWARAAGCPEADG
jgi:hypothetical protein